MPVHAIPSTVNSETCTQEAVGGKDGLEAHLQPKWAGSFSRSYNSSSLQQDARCSDRLSWMCVCEHMDVQSLCCTCAAKICLGSDPVSVLSWSFAWDMMPVSGLSPETLVRVQPGPWKCVLMKRIRFALTQLIALLFVRSDGFLGWQGCWINFILPVSEQQSC